MLPIISFGEALIDFLGTGFDENSNPTYTQFPGGAPANVAVAVAKLGGNSFFAGMLGEDMFGYFIENALVNTGVKPDYLNFTRKAKTGLAFVALDNCNERSFEFYRPPAADLLYQPQHLPNSAFQQPGIFHFCSNTLTENSIANTTETLVDRARDENQLISFDINLRQNLWPESRDIRASVSRLIDKAHILKFAREELTFMADNANAEGYIERYIKRRLAKNTELVLITDGPNPLRWYSRNATGEIQPPTVEVKDTTAGGDGFIGALLYQLAQHQVTTINLGEFCQKENFTKALQFACHAGACTVSKPGAFWALPELQDVEQSLKMEQQ